jgi:hypothetical protein
MKRRRIVLWAFAVGLAAVLLVGGCSRKKSRPQMRLESVAKMRAICVGYLKCSEAHDGRIPGSLAEIAPYMAGGVLPESPRKWEGFDGPSYIYVDAFGGRDYWDVKEPYKSVLMYENPIICKDGISVGFADGHGEWMPLEKFEAALAETYERLGVPPAE